MTGMRGVFEEKMQRLFQATGAESDTALARILGIQPPSVAGARKRRIVPGVWIEKIALDYNINADWLLFGRGEMRAEGNGAGREAPASALNTPPPAARASSAPGLCPRCGRLETRLETLDDERRELAMENRRLWKDNAQLREENAMLRERQRRAGCKDTPTNFGSAC